jgi:hypothetical protein
MVKERAMPQTHQPSPTLSPPSGYITPIACQYCTAEAHLAQLSHHPELNAELRIFQCLQCGRETELIVLR